MRSGGSEAEKIPVLVADHDVLACRLLASTLRNHRSFEVAECEDGSSVLAPMSKMRPSVAMIRPALAGTKSIGLGILREARERDPSIRTVVVLDEPEKESIIEAFRAGAKGVLVRSEYGFASLCKCVHQVQQGR